MLELATLRLVETFLQCPSEFHQACFSALLLSSIVEAACKVKNFKMKFGKYKEILHKKTVKSMAIRVVEFSSGGYKISKIFA